MNPWLETVGVVVLALLGISLGRVFSGFRRPYWPVGYFLSISLIVTLVVVRCHNSLAFMPPFSWLIAGRVKFVILCIAVTVGLTSPLRHLPRRCEKLMVCIFMVLVVIWFSVLPFLVPALISDHLLSFETQVDSNGICLQSSYYTCGPAAAVTALKKLGFDAHEGEIAVLAHTSPVSGTLPACLCSALRSRYGADGLNCRYRYFESVGQLRDAGITLVVLRDGFLSDHCVAILGVSENMVTFADPVSGKMLMSREQFEKIWRFTGIVLKRSSVEKI